MNDAFTEFSQEMIKALKASGYRSVRIAPKDDKASNHSTIELIPEKTSEFQLDLVLLESPEINNYVGQKSPMVKYIINRAFLHVSYST